MFRVGDIVFFPEYTFTDTGETMPHYGLVMLPQNWGQWSTQIYCCVITSKLPKSRLHIICKSQKYSCFNVDSYICFNRFDLQPFNGSRDQKKAELDLLDIKKGLNLLHKCIHNRVVGYSDKFLRAALIREWKSRRSELGKAGSANN